MPKLEEETSNRPDKGYLASSRKLFSYAFTII